jgi:hypothetical protein
VENAIAGKCPPRKPGMPSSSKDQAAADTELVECKNRWIPGTDMLARVFMVAGGFLYFFKVIGCILAGQPVLEILLSEGATIKQKQIFYSSSAFPFGDTSLQPGISTDAT